MRRRGLRLRGIAALAAVLAFAISCGADDQQSRETAAETPVAQARATETPSPLAGPRDVRLAEVRSWAYQLQGADGESLTLAELIASDFDLFVIDYSRDGDDAGAFTRSEIAALQSGGRIVLAYMSIGEAESYRFYWDEAWAPDGDPTDDAPG